MKSKIWFELNDKDLQKLNGGKKEGMIWINWLIDKVLNL